MRVKKLPTRFPAVFITSCYLLLPWSILFYCSHVVVIGLPQMMSFEDIPLEATRQQQRPVETSETMEIKEEEEEVAVELHIVSQQEMSSPDELNELNPGQQAVALLQKRMRRDEYRIKAISTRLIRAAGGDASITGDAIPGQNFNYITQVAVGTPPQNLFLVLDTGSDLNWIRCPPCKSRDCYHQSDPIFDPTISSTFASTGCRDPPCQLLKPYAFRGCSKSQRCLYQYSYGDNSSTVGDLVTDTLTFIRGKTGASIALRVAFGCGRQQKEMFLGEAAGFLGLGGGKFSFFNQLTTGSGGGGSAIPSRKFSICLPLNPASKSSIIFGDSNKVRPSKNTAYTPRIKNPLVDTYYYVQLEGISVGGELVAGITSSLFEINAGDGSGGLMVDSGTVVTRLIPAAYIALRDAFKKASPAAAYLDQLPPSLEGIQFDTCYNLTGPVSMPSVVFHFQGADVELEDYHYLLSVDDATMTACFAFLPSDDGISVYGNYQQKNFRVIYDLVDSRVGFDPHGCS